MPPPKPIEPEPEPTDWTRNNLWTGLTMARTWLEHLFRCVIPDREAFRGVVKDPLMTAPALLIGVLGVMLLALFTGGVDPDDWLRVPLRAVSYLVAIVALYGAGMLLTHKGSFARTTRAMGFAQSPAILLPLALYEPLAPVVLLIVNLLILVGVWTGAAIAHEVKGWKVILLPVLYILVAMVGVGAVIVILGGATVTVVSILQTTGDCCAIAVIRQETSGAHLRS